jgi:hypothetical protein
LLLMTAGVATLTTSAASAAPPQYPPTASALTVNRGTVRVGEAVRATGRGFGRNERVHVTVLYRPQHWDHYTTLFQSYSTRTSSKGKFSVSVRMHLPGTATVRAHGARSGKSASAPVRVLLFRYGSVFGHANTLGHGGWSFARAGYVASGDTATAASKVASPPRDEQPLNTPALAVAGLGAMAMAGTMLITRRQVRRRRKS